MTDNEAIEKINALTAQRDALITHAWDAIVAHREPGSSVLNCMPPLMKLATLITEITGRYPCAKDPSFNSNRKEA